MALRAKLAFMGSLGLLVTCSSATTYVQGQVPQLARHDAPYLIKPSDQLQLSFRYTPEYDETLTVEPNGEVSLKLIGSINVGGMTLAQAQASLTDRLSQRLNKPEITLVLTDFVRPSYVVTGQVAAPGKFEIHGGVSAIDAIALAGGFKDSAKSSQVILYRRTEGTDYTKMRVIDLKQFSNPKRTDLEANVPIEPGDLLVVPKSRIAKFSDYVHWVNVGTYFPLF